MVAFSQLTAYFPGLLQKPFCVHISIPQQSVGIGKGVHAEDWLDDASETVDLFFWIAGSLIAFAKTYRKRHREQATYACVSYIEL